MDYQLYPYNTAEESIVFAYEEGNRAGVLNGIAYDGSSGRFLLTGKLWPKVFEVSFVPIEDGDAAQDQN